MFVNIGPQGSVFIRWFDDFSFVGTLHAYKWV
jgi:hypothetical protein